MPKLSSDKWSVKHDHCLRCLGTSSRHEAKGYCGKCYHHVFMREWQKKWVKKYRIKNPQYMGRTKTSTGFKYSDATTPRANKCEICSRVGKTVLDHCHKTNKFRGWLCHQCNTSLGMVKDNIEVLNKMISYLVKNS